jgi:hypothetical protein
MMSNLEQELVEGIAEFKVIPFLGAGISLSLGLPNWRGLVEKLCSECGVHGNGDVFLDAQSCENKVGRPILAEKIGAILELARDLPDEKFSALYRILGLCPPIIYTTNYDEGIETACKRANLDYRKVVTLRDLRDAPHGTNLIIKYHGDIYEPLSIVLTKSDYEKRMSIESPLDIRLRSDLLGKGMVFLGYGFGDPNIEEIWLRHKSLYGAENLPKCYLVALGKDEEKANKLKELGINVISIEVKDFGNPVEFMDFLKKIHNDVFSRNMGKNVEIFGSKDIPTRRILTSEDLDALTSVLLALDGEPEAKAEELRRVLEMVIYPEGMQERVKQLLLPLVAKDSPKALQFAAAFSLCRYNDPEVLEGLLDLTENEELRHSVYSKIDMRFGNKITLVIMAYLAGKAARSEKLSFDHVDFLLGNLRCYRDTEEYKKQVESENGEQVLGFFFSNHESALKARFASSFPRKAASQIMNEMMASMPRAPRK